MSRELEKIAARRAELKRQIRDAAEEVEAICSEEHLREVVEQQIGPLADECRARGVWLSGYEFWGEVKRRAEEQIDRELEGLQAERKHSRERQ